MEILSLLTRHSVKIFGFQSSTGDFEAQSFSLRSMYLDAQEGYASYGVILVAIVLQKSLRFVVMGYRTIIAPYAANGVSNRCASV